MNSTIITDLAFIIPDATPYHFGVLTSRMHNAWMRAVCGRLKSDYRYSKDIVYNNFIWPGCGGGAQMEVWREIVARDGVAVADALNRHLFRRYLELEFPGRPMAAKFTLSNEKKPTAGEIADLTTIFRLIAFICEYLRFIVISARFYCAIFTQPYQF